MRCSSYVCPYWQCQQTPAQQMIQTYRVFSSPVVRVTSFQALDVTPPIKQAVMVPCGATSSTDIQTADWSLRLSVEPVCLKWHAYFVFRLFLFLEAFVCCIWNALLLDWEDREDLFPLSDFSLMGLCLQTSPNTKHIFQSKGVHLYTSGKHLPLFPKLAFPSSNAIAKINTVYYCFLIIIYYFKLLFIIE